ncbi:hypothetical protein BAU15_00935 [Enterococcus sp. JM4C]|nr:hypothetical protein BAU15_00935 [Enterococcus sp. JM4C]
MDDTFSLLSVDNLFKPKFRCVIYPGKLNAAFTMFITLRVNFWEFLISTETTVIYQGTKINNNKRVQFKYHIPYRLFLEVSLKLLLNVFLSIILLIILLKLIVTTSSSRDSWNQKFLQSPGGGL